MNAPLSVADRVLVRAPSWLGDFILVEPVVRALYERHAHVGNGSQLAIGAPNRWLALFEGRFEGMQRIAIAESAPESVDTWRGRDFALLLNGSWRSAWLAFTAHVPARAGFASGGRRMLLTHAFKPAFERGGVPIGRGISGKRPRALPRPFGSTCVELAQMLGVTVRDRRPRLCVAEAARTSVNARLARVGLAMGEPFVLVNAGARKGSAKGFPSARLATALDRLAQRVDLPFVIACAIGEEENARATAAQCLHARTIVFDDPPADLAELVALTFAARLVIGTDSGARHIAAALRVPNIVLCGPTDPRHTAEHLESTRVLRVEVPCGPCHREICPIEGEKNHACMNSIDPIAIADAAESLLV